MLTIRALAIAAAAAAIAVPANAVTFASFSNIGNTSNFGYRHSGQLLSRTTNGTFFTNASGVTPAAVNVRFSFTQPGFGLSSFVNNVTASLLITGTTPLGNVATGAVSQGGLTGTMTFLSTSAITVTGPLFNTTTYAAGSNLLTVSFGNAVISGTTGANTATFNGTTVSYTSDFLDFFAGSNSFANTLTNVTPTLGALTGNNPSLRSLRGRLRGLFDADTAPLADARIPEPATWALLIVGFGMVGVSLRRRRIAVAA